MSSLSDLWDEEKYSEGDPIRQLIGATKGVKDWPMDAVAWGADAVDLITAGLAHVVKQNPRLAEAIKTDLGGNLRRSTKEGYDRPTMTQGPSPDVEEGRSIGRILNPFLWAGGQKIPTPKMDLMNFNPARRAFLSARDAAYKQPIPEAAEDLGNAAGALLNVPMDRRTFNKSAVAAGGLAAGGIGGLKLIERFAPEAKQAAEAIPKGLESVQGGSHRYHSLKEYLDDVLARADANNIKSDYVNRRLMRDENYYNKIKELGPEEAAYREYFDDALETFDESELQFIKDKDASSYWSPKKLEDLPRETQKTIRDMSEHAKQRLDWFSPQAKKEMKEFKSLTKQIDMDYHGKTDWTEWMVKNKDNPEEIIEGLKRYYIP